MLPVSDACTIASEVGEHILLRSLGAAVIWLSASGWARAKLVGFVNSVEREIWRILMTRR